MKTREAKCGHAVLTHPGRQRRLCDDCIQEHHGGTAKTCRMCSAPLPPLRSGRGPKRRIYCSKPCDAHAAAARISAARLAARPPMDCAVCGKTFTRTRRDQKFCSRFCGEVSYGQRRLEPFPFAICALDGCDAEFQLKKTGQRACSEPHGKKLWHQEHPGADWNDKRRDAYHRRRAQKKSTAGARPVLLAEIRERDGNRCHLCRKKVSVKPYPHPLSASLDHIVPLSLDGEHVPENVRLAHLRCNVEKGNRGGNEQLLLIG